MKPCPVCGNPFCYTYGAYAWVQLRCLACKSESPWGRTAEDAERLWDERVEVDDA